MAEKIKRGKDRERNRERGKKSDRERKYLTLCRKTNNAAVPIVVSESIGCDNTSANTDWHS